MKINFRINSFTLLLGSGLLTEILYLSFVLLQKDRDIPLYMFTYFESFILFFFAYFLILRWNYSQKKDDRLNQKAISALKRLLRILHLDNEDTNTLKIPLLIIAFGILFRITLLPTSYSTSDDIHRYLWEGKVIVNGHNPFTTAPEDSSLTYLRDDNYEKVTFKSMSAIYPPLSQIIFAINYLVAGNRVIFLKIIYLMFEIVTLIFLLKLLLYKKIEPKLILLYAWLPLPIMEYFINAHLDVIGITFLILFLYYFEKSSYNFSSVFLALAFLTKLLALLVLPLIIKKLGVRKALVYTAIFIVTCLVLYAPFIYGNIDVLAGLFRYLQHWEFNGSVYNALKSLTSRGDFAKLVCSILLIISILFISSKYKNFIKGVFAVFFCITIFSTTLYPWYLGWIAVLNVLNPFYSIISLFFTINFSNFTPLAQKWKEYPIVWIIEYVPFYGLLLYDLWNRKLIFKK